MITIALIAWPILTLILAFRTQWVVAIAVSIIGGYLLLPEQGGIDLPLLPKFAKDTIPCLTLLVLAFLLRPGDPNGPLPDAIRPDMVQRGWVPATTLGMALLGLWIAGALMTALTNGDTLRYGSRVIGGMRLYDGFNIIVSSTAALVPLVLGRKYLAHPDAHKTLLFVFVGAALLYSLPTLYEVRMSPQLNRMFYGFFAHDWHQHTRGGGFRPVVFLKHGLKLSLFLAMGALAAFGLFWMLKGKFKTIALFGGFWLLATVVLSKSLGALLIALVLLPVVLLLPTRMKLLAVAAIAGFVLAYPMLRSVDLVPTGAVMSVAERVDPHRAASLEFRLRNEDVLLAKAAERPLFGWGGFGRNRAIDEDGRDVSVTDGSWVIAFGTGGWAEYLSKFGLMTLPIIVLAIRRNRYEVTPATVVIAVILVANALDLIPNSGQSPILWLMAGALLGRLELGKVTEPGTETSPPDPRRARGAYARSTPALPRLRDATEGAVYTRQRQHHRRQKISKKAQHGS